MKSGVRETEQAEFTPMIVVRFLLRFLLVPLGAVVATGVALLFIVVAHWNRFAALIAAHTDPPEAAAFILLLMAPMLVLSIAAIGMMSPAAIGVLIAEVFAIRSWMFHVANGGLSATFGWFALEDVRRPYEYFDEPLIVIGAGIAAGFAYWAVAGWNAGFWKPVFEPPPQRRADKKIASPVRERRSSRQPSGRFQRRGCSARAECASSFSANAATVLA